MLSQSQPNPFVAERGPTAIGFALDERAHAKLCVFDATGRLVRVLVDAPLDAGPHAVWWDGAATGAGSRVRDLLLPPGRGTFSESRTLVKLR